MKQLKNILFIVLGIFLISSCNKKIEQLQPDPNNPASVPPQLILGTVLTDISGTGTQGNLGGINSWDLVMGWNQYHCQNYDYYGNNIYAWASGSFDPYLVIKNVGQMEKEVTSRGGSDVNAFEAVGRFIRAYYYYNLTSLFGDVPLTDALLAPTNSTPKYTPQEQVFLYVLNQLDTANTHLAQLIAANDVSLMSTQDIYYGLNNPVVNGDGTLQLRLWQKTVNSFKLRVLVALSNKASDGTLNVASQFAAIINNPAQYPIYADQSEDLKFVFNPGGANTYSTYPFNPSNFGSIAQRFNMASTYVDALTSLKDARVFVTCDPAWGLVGVDTAQPAKFQYFAGASTGEPVQTMYSNAAVWLYSFINRYRYYSNYTGDPNVLVGYKEMCFNIAEGIERGWAAGNAETWYKAGITASMAFYGIDVSQPGFTAYFLPKDKNSVTQVQPYPVNFDFNAYYAQPSVTLSGTTATAINQIVLQKYIACFESSGYEGYYTWRRTGVPAFQGGPGVGNNDVIPIRWAYPVTEQVQNKANWSSALSAQGFAQDDLNQKMWLLQ
ncbi:MAG: SusD/RagB family nutrient-binding outer membrane lipoprotein [Chitinophagales bacterium]